MRRRSACTLSTAFALGDATVLVALDALVAALLLPVGGSFADRLEAVLVTAGALAAGLHLNRVYVRARRRLVPLATDDLGSLCGGLVVGLVLLVAITRELPSAVTHLVGVSPPLLTAGLGVLALPLGRSVLLHSRRREQRNLTRVLVLGTGRVAAEISARLLRTGQVEIVGYVDDDPAGDDPVVGGLDGLAEACEELEVDRVVVAFSRSHPARTSEVLRALPPRVIVDVVPRYFEITGWQSTLDDVSGLTLVSLGDRSPSTIACVTKRVIDVVVSVAALTLTLPFVVLAAIFIRLDSDGPALFRQERLGKRREAFLIWKLRTMQVRRDEPSSSRRRHPASNEQDTAITRVGRIVRRLGLDELPQLVNVLRGEMSLVGPRPLVRAECDAVEAWANHRFDVRPGITGLWQVCGQHDLSFDELCRLDYQYATSWSLATDLRIIAKTPGRLLRGGGGLGPTIAPPAERSATTARAEFAPKQLLLVLPSRELDRPGRDGRHDELAIPLRDRTKTGSD